MDTSTLSIGLFGGSLLAAVGASWILFQELADMSQLVIPTNRRRVVAVWRRRRLIAGVALVGMAGSAALWRQDPGLMPGWLLAVILLLSAALLYAGLVNPQLMFRSQQRTARFMSTSEARRWVRPDESVIVIEINGDARAYTARYLLQPHIAHSESVGGEDVVMTYCGLTNLGIAYTPEIDGQRLDLRVMNQIENNLIMWDANTGTPIQQIWGYREGAPEKRRMREWPTRRMPFSAFCELFPEGRVFANEIAGVGRNPVRFAWDTGVRRLMTAGVRKQERSEKPAFPSIDHTDTRLPMKAKIYGFNVGADYVAYTIESVRASGGIVNATVGGRPVAVVYHVEYDSLGVYYNDTDGPVGQVDVHGTTPQGRQLKPVESLKAGAYWFIWCHFFPTTDVNRGSVAPGLEAVSPPRQP